MSCLNLRGKVTVPFWHKHFTMETLYRAHKCPVFLNIYEYQPYIIVCAKSELLEFAARRGDGRALLWRLFWLNISSNSKHPNLDSLKWICITWLFWILFAFIISINWNLYCRPSLKPPCVLFPCCECLWITHHHVYEVYQILWERWSSDWVRCHGITSLFCNELSSTCNCIASLTCHGQMYSHFDMKSLPFLRFPCITAPSFSNVFLKLTSKASRQNKNKRYSMSMSLPCGMNKIHNASQDTLKDITPDQNSNSDDRNMIQTISCTPKRIDVKEAKCW